ncbi:MAG: hypothetical protein LBH82_04340, partial [Bacteroidales bacterium]|nr:hypothetical protein [Bacteroidales bacterium]
YRHISDYEHWKQELGKELANYPNTPWIDWQIPFDTATFTPECFENTYDKNQHLSNYGMIITAYKLANMLKDSNRYDFPDRSKEKEWLADFSNQPHFILNQPMPATMQNVYQVAKDETINNLEVTEMLVMQEKDYDQIVMKINKNQQLPQTLHCVLQGELAGQKLQFQILFIKIQGINPVGFDVYIANIRNDLKVEKIMSIQH